MKTSAVLLACLFVVSFYSHSASAKLFDFNFLDQNECFQNAYHECSVSPSAVFSADFMVLSRHDDVSGNFLFNNTTLQPLLDLEALSGQTSMGVRFGLTLFESSQCAYEFNYFQMDRFDGIETRSTPDLITFPFFGGVPANPQSSYTVKYRSLFQGFEANQRKILPSGITGLAGFRFIEIREKFDQESGSGEFVSGVDNDLYGFQLGGEMVVATYCRSKLVTTLKGGVFYNNADVLAQAANPGGGLLKFINDEDEVAFVGELMMGLFIPMGPQANFRIGYQMFYLDGVGLAPDQNGSYSIFTGQGTFQQNDLWFHGGYVGFELFW